MSPIMTALPTAASLKQKINTRCSTKCELVGVDDVMGQILWTNYFLRAQGYFVKDTIVYQDNKSAILLEKNGRASSSKRTKHIKVQYFFIKDQALNQVLEVQSLLGSYLLKLSGNGYLWMKIIYMCSSFQAIYIGIRMKKNGLKLMKL